jgi:uncharacterized membrane protein YfcA
VNDAALFLVGAAMALVISAFGAGGSLFIVPILIYGFDLPVTTATGTSLAVVTIAAAVGAIGHWRAGRFRPHVVVVFGGMAMIGAIVGASLHRYVSDRVTVVLFAIALFVAGLRMFLGNPPRERSEDRFPWQAAPLGLVLGVMTGFLGVGGGFLIVPVLIYGARLSLRDAIGSSLGVIAVSGVSGVIGYALQRAVDPAPLVPLAGGAIIGAVAGSALSGRVAEKPLRYGFGAMAFVVGAWMLAEAIRGG